jgi:hypothetical protein
MAMKKKSIIDITDSKSEFVKIDSEFSLLNQRFMALAMDYKHFIDSSILDNKIYALRDNTNYRLYSAKFHIELLFNHISNIEKNVENQTIIGTPNQIPVISYIPIYTQQITSLFDSFIYHTVSVFDYISTLANYVSGEKKENTLMWTQLAKSVRDKKNIFSLTRFSTVIDKIDREFVGKLYDHRALLIHRRADIGGFNLTHSLGYQETVTMTFFAGRSVIKCFKRLTESATRGDITLRYVAVWILNEVIKNITDILFSMKEEIESKDIGKEPVMFYLHPETKEKLPISVNYWNEKLYKKNKNSW